MDLANFQQIYDYDNLVGHVAYITILIPKQSKLSHIFTSDVGHSCSPIDHFRERTCSYATRPTQFSFYPISTKLKEIKENYI